MWKCTKNLATFTKNKYYKGGIDKRGILELFNNYNILEVLIYCRPYFIKDKLYFHSTFGRLKSIFL